MREKMSAICLRCRQQYSEKYHECLQEMTLEELFDPQPVPSMDLEIDENGDFKLSDGVANLKEAILRKLKRKKPNDE